MSEERTDHAAEARRVIAAGENAARAAKIEAQSGNRLGADAFGSKAHGCWMQAQVHATLALVEQQRIANLIALGAPQKLIGGGEASVPSWDAQYQLRPEIAEALGLS